MTIIANITPEVLAWARKTAGYEIESIVKKFKQKRVDEQVVSDWERGVKKPTYVQLEKLAKIYNRPIAVFFFPEPPPEESIEEKLRALPKDYAQSLPPQINYLVRKAQSRKINLHELYDDILPNDFQSFSHSFNESKNDAKELANEVRKILGVSTDDQFNWRDPDTALKNWRSKLEEAGIWIFKDSFDKDYSGFCLCDTHIPVIYINNSMSKTRQIFTLFHELAHLLIEKSGVDFRRNVENEFPDTHKKEEVFCNAFAGSVLVPEHGFDINKYSDSQIADFARQYKVSREVILREYLDQGIINQDEYFSKVQKWWLRWQSDQNEEREQKERNRQLGNTTSGPSYYRTQKSYLGDKYLNLAFSQYYRNRISEIQLADYLGVKVKSLSGLESYMLENR